MAHRINSLAAYPRGMATKLSRFQKEPHLPSASTFIPPCSHPTAWKKHSARSSLHHHLHSATYNLVSCGRHGSSDVPTMSLTNLPSLSSHRLIISNPILRGKMAMASYDLRIHPLNPALTISFRNFAENCGHRSMDVQLDFSTTTR